MKLFNDGDRSTTNTLAAKAAQVSRRVWLGWSIPRMQPPSKRDNFPRLLNLMTARNQQGRRQRRSVLNRIGIQLSALPPPIVRQSVPPAVNA